MPMPRKKDPSKNCEHCGEGMERTRMSGRLEDRTAFLNRKYCNTRCMALAMMKEFPTRSAIQKRIAVHRKDSCESCGGQKRLGIHHKDRNWRNNELSNLQTLCASCHTSLHHAAGDIIKKKEKPPCMVCGKPSYRLELCSTHRTRARKHGNPYLTRKLIGASWQLVLDASGPSGRALAELGQMFPIGHTDLEPSETP